LLIIHCLQLSLPSTTDHPVPLANASNSPFNETLQITAVFGTKRIDQNPVNIL
jgi:hypothetical protein